MKKRYAQGTPFINIPINNDWTFLRRKIYLTKFFYLRNQNFVINSTNDKPFKYATLIYARTGARPLILYVLFSLKPQHFYDNDKES